MTAALGLISRVEMELLGKAPGWMTPTLKWNKFYLYPIGVILQQNLQCIEDRYCVFRAVMVKPLKVCFPRQE